MKILNTIGISSPRILQRINRIRVDLEHFYKCPKPANVINAIDVAHLFLDATLYPLTNFTDAFSIYSENEENKTKFFSVYNGMVFLYNEENGEYTVKYLKDGTIIKHTEITSDNLVDYLKLVIFSIKIGKIVEFDDIVQKELAISFLSNIGLDIKR